MLPQFSEKERQPRGPLSHLTTKLAFLFSQEKPITVERVEPTHSIDSVARELGTNIIDYARTNQYNKTAVQIVERLDVDGSVTLGLTRYIRRSRGYDKLQASVKYPLSDGEFGFNEILIANNEYSFKFKKENGIWQPGNEISLANDAATPYEWDDRDRQATLGLTIDLFHS